MSDRAVEKLETEYDDANDRINNIGLADNGEAEILDKNLTNIKVNAAKSETTETTGMGYVENSGPNAIPTEKWTS